MYLISVYFDENTNKIIQRMINQVAEKTGNHFMTDNNVPPHMTISAIEARDISVLLPVFETFKDIEAGEIQFVSVGQFFPYVMYITPVLSEYLHNLQTRIYNAVSDIDETSVSNFYRPYSWLPHITIGKKLDDLQMKRAFAIMKDNFVPFKAKVVKIGLAKVNPHEDVMVFELGKSGCPDKV